MESRANRAEPGKTGVRPARRLEAHASIGRVVKAAHGALRWYARQAAFVPLLSVMGHVPPAAFYIARSNAKGARSPSIDEFIAELKRIPHTPRKKKQGWPKFAVRAI